MQAKLIRQLVYGPSAGSKNGQIAHVGDIIDAPDAWQLVFNGDAEPYDEECATRCKSITQDSWKDILERREMAARGIAPEDIDRYRSGEIQGYNPDGSYIPGDNAEVFSDDDDSGEDPGEESEPDLEDDSEELL